MPVKFCSIALYSSVFGKAGNERWSLLIFHCCCENIFSIFSIATLYPINDYQRKTYAGAAWDPTPSQLETLSWEELLVWFTALLSLRLYIFTGYPMQVVKNEDVLSDTTSIRRKMYMMDFNSWWYCSLNYSLFHSLNTLIWSENAIFCVD